MVFILINTSQPFSCHCSLVIHLYPLGWEALIRMVQIMERHNKTFFMETWWTISSVLSNTQWSMKLLLGNTHLGHLYSSCGIHKVPVQLSAQSYCFLSHLRFPALPCLFLCFLSSTYADLLILHTFPGIVSSLTASWITWKMPIHLPELDYCPRTSLWFLCTLLWLCLLSYV